uniref:G domain-containing protein n=2 Tax=Macrostomum lignano TaxID=282301 RepID=A0A1I8GMT7_9PLAT
MCFQSNSKSNSNAAASKRSGGGGSDIVDSLGSTATNERILKECHHLYANEENGLAKLAQLVNVKLLPPRKKITVLLIGNHSAGKSAFINWYIEKQIQKEGVAIETQGITIVTQGKRRESLSGNATLHLFPQLAPLAKFDGVVSNLSTELCDSIAKRFALVTFIDTPGLVDGSMSYAFDVNRVLLWLAVQADLVFAFFDPIGQALCKRTMQILADIGDRIDRDRIVFFLSKADESGDETDRQRVLMQITQEVCKWPSLNRTCFDIHTIYNPNRAKPTRCVNQIDEAAKTIDKAIQMTLQHTLNALEHDCKLISRRCHEDIAADAARGRANCGARFRFLLFSLLALVLPVLLAICVSQPVAIQLLGYSTPLHDFLVPLYRRFPAEYSSHLFGGVAAVALFCFVLARLCGRTAKRLTRAERRRLGQVSDHVTGFVEAQRKELYTAYLKQSVKDSDF